MKKKHRIPIQNVESTAFKKLLYALLFIAIYLLVSQIYLTWNTRENTPLTYDDGSESLFITHEMDESSVILYAGENWCFVPNITSEDIKSGSFRYNDHFNIPYASDVTLGSPDGWNDLGNSCIWNNTDSAPAFIDYDIDGRTYNCGVYIMKIIFAKGAPNVSINVPDIVGHADLYCNGAYVGSFGDSMSPGSVSLTDGYDSLPVPINDNGQAEIMIAVSSRTDIAKPGITSIPSLASARKDATLNALSAIWYTFQGTLVVILLIGGFVIASTLENKSKFYVVLMGLTSYILYNVTDERVICFESLERVVCKFVFQIFLSIIIFGFISSLFQNSDTEKTPSLFHFDYIIVMVLGWILIIIEWVNRDLISTSYQIGASIILTVIVSVACLIKILFFYMEDNNASIALITVITYAFCMINMINDASGIFTVPLYSTFFVISLIAVEILFFFKYVYQYRQLNATTTHLQVLVDEKTKQLSDTNKYLTETNSKLLENEEARKNVLSNVSHDLRTPITAIRGYAELLRTAGKNMSDEQVITYLTNIIKRSEQMERIVSDIVELTRMESNASSEFQFCEMSVAELLDELCMMYSTDLKGTDKHISLDIPDDDLLIVNADPKKLSRVFENLISNSINYTYDQAMIKISAYRTGEKDDPSSQRVHVVISDNGIGIPKEEINKIFDRFYRAKNSGKNIKGTGLGLSIVKTIIDHHGAEIEAESSLGSGTTFHIILKP